MDLLLYAHGGSYNHGCEAIIRSTADIFRGSNITLFSNRSHEDADHGIDALCQLIDPKRIAPKRVSWYFVRAYWDLKMKGDSRALDNHHVKTVLSHYAKDRIALSVGGDNYCYAGAEKYGEFRETLRKHGAKTVLWGCSVGPDDLTDASREDISRYDLVTARESITFETIRKINPNTVLAPDPAFTLKMQPGNLPVGLGDRPYIGINVSPLVQGLEGNDGITVENYCTLLDWILKNTDRDIALIPHVVWAHNDDRIPLEQLYRRFSDVGRLFVVEDQNCMQLKDIISGCEFFVGARTHSTIAAYSTCVPTLVLGYSVKARGIARDLFGSEKGYVLPVQQLKEKEDLTNAFKALYSRKDDIRKHLTDMMPGYIRGIDAAREAVEKL